MLKKLTRAIGFGVASMVAVSAMSASAKSLPIESLNLPDGFEIEVYAEVPNARQMTQGAKGSVYVGTRRLGKVFAVIDRDGDWSSDEVVEIASDLNLPSGVAYRDGDLYVGAVSQILRFENIDQSLLKSSKTIPNPSIYIDGLPKDRHHGWKFIDFGPDGHLYVPVGAPCNICLSDDPRYASILRFDPTNLGDPDIYASGVRNTVGFDWHPESGNLWFSDNGGDNLGDELPACELNEVTIMGQHFGYPYFHAESIPDPKFGEKGAASSEYKEPEMSLGPHVAPLGIHFYTGKMFADDLEGKVLIAEHGSWNRTPEAGHTGYRVTLGSRVDGEMQYSVLIDGWLQDTNEAWGRPVDLLELEDGSILLSDDRAGVIYRLSRSR